MKWNEWTFRAKLFVKRFWQPTSACMTCMPGSLGSVLNMGHWEIALRTGLLTGMLVVLLSVTPLIKLFRNRFGNAFTVGCLTALGDGLSHESHSRIPYGESIMTGVISGLLAIAGSYLLENRARRVRAMWARFIR